MDTTVAPFLLALLADLRAARFTPLAWWCFLVRSWEQSLLAARQSPALVAATARATVWLLLLAVTWLAPLFLRPGLGHGGTAAAVVLAGLALQQLFVWLHLGMVQPLAGGPRLAHLGVANRLTLVRLLAAWLLLGDALAGVTSRTLLFGVLLMGIVTDALDGAIARRLETPTRLGRMLDGIGDTLLFSTAALVFAGRGLLPGWFAALVLLRFALPFAWALASYFLQLRPVRYVPTRWGKAAGAALSLAMLATLLSTALGSGRAEVASAFLWPVAVLLVLAVAVQLWQEQRRWRGQT